MTMIEAYNGALAVLEDYSSRTGVPVWQVLSGFADFFRYNLASELSAEMADAADNGDDEADFYAAWLDRGITPDTVSRYVSEDAGRHMRVICEDHGLI